MKIASPHVVLFVFIFILRGARTFFDNATLKEHDEKQDWTLMKEEYIQR